MILGLSFSVEQLKLFIGCWGRSLNATGKEKIGQCEVHYENRGFGSLLVSVMFSVQLSPVNECVCQRLSVSVLQSGCVCLCVILCFCKIYV